MHNPKNKNKIDIWNKNFSFYLECLLTLNQSQIITHHVSNTLHIIVDEISNEILKMRKMISSVIFVSKLLCKPKIRIN